jgi:hypothetical protein
MSYIVKVKGYSSFWTGNMEPGMLWSDNINEALIFDSEEEANEIANSGNNMEYVKKENAFNANDISVPDWNRIETGVVEARKRMKPKGFGEDIKSRNKDDSVEEIELTEEDFVELDI